MPVIPIGVVGRGRAKDNGKGKGKDKNNGKDKDMGKDMGKDSDKGKGNDMGKDMGNDIGKDMSKDMSKECLLPCVVDDDSDDEMSCADLSMKLMGRPQRVLDPASLPSSWGEPTPGWDESIARDRIRLEARRSQG